MIQLGHFDTWPQKNENSYATRFSVGWNSEAGRISKGQNKRLMGKLIALKGI